MKECSVKQQEYEYGPEMALLAATRHCTIENYTKGNNQESAQKTT